MLENMESLYGLSSISKSSKNDLFNNGLKILGTFKKFGIKDHNAKFSKLD